MNNKNIKNKLIATLLVIVAILNISSNCFASLTDGEVRIVAGWSGDLYYSYNKEERKAVRRSCNNYPVYMVKKNNNGGNIYANNLEIYNNDDIKNILKNGYGVKTEEELSDLIKDENVGSLTMVEAFLATQEAIYIKLEGRDINDYVIDSIKGTRILTTTKKILEKASKEKSDFVLIDEVDKEWNYYEPDNGYKYKNYTIKSSNKNQGKIELLEGDDCKIIDNITNKEKTVFLNEDTFCLKVPKNNDQTIKIRTSFEKEGLLVYLYKKSNDLKEHYILSEPGIEHIDIDKNIKINGNTEVEILNIDKETKEAIEGNSFSIINEDSYILKNNLTTDKEGKINLTLDKGKYYLRQDVAISEYVLNKTLIEMDIKNEKQLKIKIENSKPVSIENTITNKEINVEEENINIVENNVTDISNIKTTNINKEIVNITNETNLHNINNFINTTNINNKTNLTKENTYNKNIQENVVKQVLIRNGDNKTLNMTRKDYVNYIDMILIDNAKVPILPVASK